MDWADELAASVSGPQVVNDSKTPSGTVHVGSLRGLETTLLYGVDDLDPMDAQALLTPDAVEHEMGRPLAHVPDQAGDGHPSYARHHAQIFVDLFARLGIHPDRYYWMSEIYAAGDVDPYIRIALDRAPLVREIYRRVANVQHPDEWHPVQVVCEDCGKVGTTIVTKWDGERVFYECRATLVTWARGCGRSGWTSPFGGRAKLGWNLEWAAQWSLFGVTIEPVGKDLSTAGGSRDRSDAIAREVFEREPPINVPYEFLNIGGKKMSTSKGHGAPAHKIVDVIPPDQLRFLFVRPRPNSAIEFDPDGTDAIPRLFDEFDRVGDATAGREVKGTLPPAPERLFAYAVLATDPATVAAQAAAFRLAFAHVAFLIQQPAADLATAGSTPALGSRVLLAAEAEKGSPLTDLEIELLTERATAARRWLDTYAPEEARVAVRTDGLPAEAGSLDAGQAAFLGGLADRAADPAAPTSGAAWQAQIFETAKALELPAGRAFAAIYAAFLGRTSGPRAGWLLASLERGFVVERLLEAAGRRAAAGGNR